MDWHFETASLLSAGRRLDRRDLKQFLNTHKSLNTHVSSLGGYWRSGCLFFRRSRRACQDRRGSHHHCPRTGTYLVVRSVTAAEAHRPTRWATHTPMHSRAHRYATNLRRDPLLQLQKLLQVFSLPVTSSRASLSTTLGDPALGDPAL